MEIIGKILRIFEEEYKSGGCENISSEDVINALTQFYDTLTNKQEKVLTTEQASLFLNVTRQTINNYVKQGKLHPQKKLGGVKEYKMKELKTLIKDTGN